jgi:hypothetical protein
LTFLNKKKYFENLKVSLRFSIPPSDECCQFFVFQQRESRHRSSSHHGDVVVAQRDVAAATVRQQPDQVPVLLNYFYFSLTAATNKLERLSLESFLYFSNIIVQGLEPSKVR